jgi:hypothetical protein
MAAELGLHAAYPRWANGCIVIAGAYQHGDQCKQRQPAPNISRIFIFIHVVLPRAKTKNQWGDKNDRIPPYLMISLSYPLQANWKLVLAEIKNREQLAAIAGEPVPAMAREERL